MAQETYVGPDQYVKVTGKREDGSPIYQAGPKSQKYETGQIVSDQYAKSVLGAVTFRNKVTGLLSNIEDKDRERRSEKEQEILEGGYQAAQSAQSDFVQLSKELNKAQKQDNEPLIQELEQEINDLRGDLGSP